MTPEWKADPVDRATQVMKLVVAQEATQGRAASCQRLAEALAEAGLLTTHHHNNHDN